MYEVFCGYDDESRLRSEMPTTSGAKSRSFASSAGARVARGSSRSSVSTVVPVRAPPPPPCRPRRSETPDRAASRCWRRSAGRAWDESRRGERLSASTAQEAAHRFGVALCDRAARAAMLSVGVAPTGRRSVVAPRTWGSAATAQPQAIGPRPFRAPGAAAPLTLRCRYEAIRTAPHSA